MRGLDEGDFLRRARTNRYKFRLKQGTHFIKLGRYIDRKSVTLHFMTTIPFTLHVHQELEHRCRELLVRGIQLVMHITR